MAITHPWMPFYVMDWLEDREIRKMSRIARSFYFDMLLHEWIGGPLPDDLHEVAAILNELPRSLAPHWESIRQRFVVDSSSKLSHTKLESLRNEARIKSEKSAKAAKERWSRDADALPTPMSVAMPSDQSQSTAQKKSTLAPVARVSFDFEALYEKYPLKKGKAKGLEKLRALVKTEAEFRAVTYGMECFLRDEKRKGTETNFYPHFSTWVNSKRWQDYTEGQSGNGPPSGESRPTLAERALARERERLNALAAVPDARLEQPGLFSDSAGGKPA